MSSDNSTPPSANSLGPDSPMRPTKIHQMVLVLAAAISLVLYLHRYTWNIIRPELAREYGFSNTELAQIFTSFQFSYALGQIPSGVICDFFGARYFLSAIIGGWSLSLVLFTLGGSFAMFILARVIFGAAQAGAYPSLSNVSRNWFPIASRTTMQGFVASFAGRAGGALAPILMATVLMSYFGLDWRVAIVVMALIGLLLAVAFFVYYRNNPEEDKRVNEAEKELLREVESHGETKRRVMSFKQAIKNRGFVTMVSAQVANAGADIVYTSVLGSFFLSKGISIAEMGIYSSFPLFGGALGGLVGGYLNDYVMKRIGSRKWGRRIMGSTGKFLAAICLFYAIAETSVLAIATGLFIVKFFSDWSQPTVWGTCTDIGGPHSATVFSVVNTAGNVGAILMPLLAIGPLLDKFSTTTVTNGITETVTNYYPMFVVVAALYVVTGLCWLTIDCTKRIRSQW